MSALFNMIDSVLLYVFNFVLICGVVFFIGTFVDKKHKNLWNILSIMMFGLATMCGVDIFFFLRGLFSVPIFITAMYSMLCSVSFTLLTLSLVMIYRNNTATKA